MGGWARCGEGGAICIADYSHDRLRLLVAHVGEDGFLPHRWTCIEDGRIVQPADVLDIDERGYVLRYDAKRRRYTAGCRDLDPVEALAHWSDPDHKAPESAAILLAAVLANEQKIKEKDAEC